MYVLAIDQGTTGTTTIAYGQDGLPIARAYREIPQFYPHPGWVEHDPEAIWASVVDTVAEVVAEVGERPAAVGITNQRETTVLWDRRTGLPLYRAVVWQCRRTSPICKELKPHEDLFRRRTGLGIDPYFSGTKIRWILDNADIPDSADPAFGTIDSWLMWKLTEGEVHATDLTNASRTLMLDLENGEWDPNLCSLLGVPREVLPELRPSIHDFGCIRAIPAVNGTPIKAVAGDQQAALAGQACFSPGQIKNTYGTGCFMLMNTGPKPVRSKQGLLTTLAVGSDGATCYALEGAVFIAGAAIQWLRDELKIIGSAAQSEELAAGLEDSGGVYMVPAFTGLGAPHWAPEARGIITGLTRGSNRQHIVRAALESIAYQSHDVFAIMEKESGQHAPFLAVDGGACMNDLLMQFQADIIDREIRRPRVVESTSLGAAYLAGLGAGIWSSTSALKGLKRSECTFRPTMTEPRRNELIEGWRRALRQTLAK